MIAALMTAHTETVIVVIGTPAMLVVLSAVDGLRAYSRKRSKE